LDQLPELVVLSKADLAPPERIDELVGGLRERTGGPVLAISAATGLGIDQLVQALFAAIPAEAAAYPAAPGREAEEAAGIVIEHMTYRPAGEQGFDVVREGDGFRVHGRGIELLVARHHL
jgi:hypothetical protein